MKICNQRNQFHFDHKAVRLFASAMDLRPFLDPTGWVLYIRESDEWALAEYGIAYSALSAQVHAEEAKGRYLRRVYFNGRYERELSLRERRDLHDRINAEHWIIETHEASTHVQVTEFRGRVKSRADYLERRDTDRLRKMRARQKFTALRRGR